MRPGEMGTREQIEAYAAQVGVATHHVELGEQLRCGGSEKTCGHAAGTAGVIAGSAIVRRRRGRRTMAIQFGQICVYRAGFKYDRKGAIIEPDPM
ncbi:hypothetical protein GCM10009773_28780 [Williamsia serinedens]